MILEYSSNNSGGGWWLTDENWQAMEAAGWTVKWVKDDDAGGLRSVMAADGRWLGALATEAQIVVTDERHADDVITQWETLTGQMRDIEGCSCCGRPHHFSLTTDDGKWVPLW